MFERPEPGVRGDRDAITTGEEGDTALDTPDDSTPSGADHPFEPTGPGQSAAPDDPA